jgi:threonine dehydrogenase-like Zn-dependent dehydrogenase
MVCGLTRDKARLEIAKAFGAIPIDVEETDIAETVLRHAPQGADIVYACSGAQTELAAASRVVRKGGRIATLGLPGEPSSLEVTPIVMRQIEIIGTRGYNDSTWPLAISWLEQVGHHALQLITHALPLSRFDEAFQLVERREATKIVLTPEFAAMAPPERTSP